MSRPCNEISSQIPEIVKSEDEDWNFIGYNENEIVGGGKTCIDPFTLEENIPLNHLHSEDEAENRDNILLFRFGGDDDDEKNFLIDCYTRSYLKMILKDNTKGRIICDEEITMDDGTIKRIEEEEKERSITFVSPWIKRNRLGEVYYRLDFHGGSFYYVSKDDILKMINSDRKIFYIERAENVRRFPRSASMNVIKNEERYLETGRPYEGGYLIGAAHCQPGTEIDVARVFICGGNGDNCLNEVLDEINIRDYYRRLIALMLSDNLIEFEIYLNNCLADPNLRTEVLTYDNEEAVIDVQTYMDLLGIAITQFKLPFISKIISNLQPSGFYDYTRLNQIITEMIRDKNLKLDEIKLKKLLYHYLSSIKNNETDESYQEILNDLIYNISNYTDLPRIANFLDRYFRTDAGINSPEVQELAEITYFYS